MIHSISLFSIILILSINDVAAQHKSICSFKWTLGQTLPAESGRENSLGFAGAINGISNDVLIVAGGANFPNGMPWEGGKKFYSNKIYVLQKDGNKFFWNKNVRDTLPEPVAYCGSTSTHAGIFFGGGENENGISDNAFLLNWNADKNKVDITLLPHLPLPLTNIASTHIHNVVYIAGGDEEKISSCKFLKLDLNNKSPQWEVLPELPAALANAILVAQMGSDGLNIYLIGGRSKTATGISDLHNTTFAFNPLKNEWKKLAPISDGKNIANLSAAAGVAIGNHCIVMLGGDNGIIFHKIESYLAQIAQVKTPEEKAKLTKEKNDLIIYHSGFSKDILLYNTLSDSWTKAGELPFPAQVTTNAVKWEDDIVISNGEIKPGVRTPNVIIGKIIN